jgi:hypothetical protein
MTMRHLLLLGILLVSGCSGSTHPAPTGHSCNATSTLECVPLASMHIHFSGCLESGFTMPLPTAVFALPPGYNNSPPPAGAQQVAVQFDKCATGQLNDLALTNVGFGFASILVRAPDRGQGTTIPNEYDLEVFTSSPDLRSIFAMAGFPALNASIAISDQGALRQDHATGGVNYNSTVEFAPVRGGSGVLSDAHHSLASWYDEDRDCTLYQGTATAQLFATSGILTQATRAGEPLIGHGTQTILCSTLTLQFGPP